MNDEQSVDKYTKDLEKIKEDITKNTMKVADHFEEQPTVFVISITKIPDSYQSFFTI
jgi:hypothetical protein